MICVLCNLTVIIYDDIIHNAVVAIKACEDLIYSVVVVLRYGGYTIRSSEVLEPPKRCNEGSEELTFIIQWALMIALHCDQFGKDFYMIGVDVCNCLGRGC